MAVVRRPIATLTPKTLPVSKFRKGPPTSPAARTEALGGTMDFKTDNPLDEERVRVSATIGDHEAQRFYGRYDTGLFLNRYDQSLDFHLDAISNGLD